MCVWVGVRVLLCIYVCVRKFCSTAEGDTHTQAGTGSHNGCPIGFAARIYYKMPNMQRPYIEYGNKIGFWGIHSGLDNSFLWLKIFHCLAGLLAKAVALRLPLSLFLFHSLFLYKSERPSRAGPTGGHVRKTLKVRILFTAVLNEYANWALSTAASKKKHSTSVK